MASFMDFSGLTLKEKVTLKYHIISAFLEGFAVGFLGLNEFIFLKSLDAPSYLLGVLFQISMVVMLFSVLFNQVIKRFRDKKKLYIISVWLTRIPLALAVFFTPETRGEVFFHYFFLSIYLAYCFTTPLIMPIFSMIVKQNYRTENFGRLYSNVAVINKLAGLVTIFIFGFILDQHNFSFRYIYPVSAALSIISAYVFIKIPYKDKTVHLKTSMTKSVANSFKEMAAIVKTNKPYRDFETAFMFYGLAFMIFTPVMTIYFEKELNLSYSSVSFYKNQATLFSLLLLPFMGRYISRTDPRKFGSFTFLSLLIFILIFSLTKFYQGYFDIFNIRIYYTLFVAHFFLAVFFASMLLLWDIGSTYFCKSEEVGSYQSIHITMTGFRGLFAPLIGVAIYSYIGYYSTFLIAAVIMLFAIYIMYYSMKKYPDHNSSEKFREVK
jgi:Na+/melibiose symporter-like transporter